MQLRGGLRRRLWLCVAAALVLGRRLGRWWPALWGLGVARRSFYRPSRAVELGGAWVEAGERCGAPLMELQPLARVGTRWRGRRGGHRTMGRLG